MNESKALFVLLFCLLITHAVSNKLSQIELFKSAIPFRDIFIF